MTTIADNYLMTQADPPATKRGRKPNPMVAVRREQLQQNPDVWFVWQDDAKNPSYVRKSAWQLMGLLQGDKLSLKEIPYQFKCVRNEGDKTFTIYVKYTAKEGN